MNYDLIIVGAGPVGLMLANVIVTEKPCSILILEKENAIPLQSRAIGVTPPTVELFRSLGLAESLIERAVSITKAVVHSRTKIVGSLSFDTLPTPHKAILSIPQYETESILEQRLQNFTTVTKIRGSEVISVSSSETSVEVQFKTETGIQKATGNYLAACDGAKSVVREQCGMVHRGGRYRDTFVMADFVDRSDLGSEAHLFFTESGAIESFPLPDGKRRWVVQTDTFVNHPSIDVQCELVQKRSGYILDPKDLLWITPFGVQHYINDSFYSGRVFYCGDSAHVMSPIGGQGMNTGFGDAEFLAAVIISSLNRGSLDLRLTKMYNICRKEAVRSAQRRAWISMRIGTAQGALAPIRDLLLKLLLNSPARNWGARHFAMLTIPSGTLTSAQKRRPKLSKMLSMHKFRP